MSDIGLFSDNELTTNESEERAFHEGVVDDVKDGIEKLASIGDASLKVLRDKRLYRSTHKTFEEYCKGRFGIVRTTANRGIAFAGIIENLMPQGIKILPATERQARPLTTLPGPESQALAWELAQATSQKDQPSNREVTEAVAQVKAELEAEKLRAEEFREESNARRKKIRELEQQVDLLKAEKPEPEVVEKIIEKPVIPPEFASLEDALKAKRTELENLSRNTQDAIQKNKTVYESRERLKKEVEDLTALLSKHKASEREQVEHKRLTDSIMQSTALFLSEIQALEHAPSAEQRRRWDQAIQQLMDSASAARNIIDALNSMPLEGILIEQAA